MDKKTVTLQLFMKTGGPQPETWDPEAINKYFIGNFAKQWAMCDGYLPSYLGYENGVIRFKLVTDQPLMSNQKHQLSEDKKVLKVELTVYNSGELIRAILGYGASVKVISPVEVVNLIKKRLETAIKHYN